MNLYETTVSATVLVEAPNVAIAKQVAKKNVKVIGNCVGFSHNINGTKYPYRVEIEKHALSNPKRIKT